METAHTLMTVPVWLKQVSGAPEPCLYESFTVLHSEKSICEGGEGGEEGQRDQNTQVQIFNQ